MRKKLIMLMVVFCIGLVGCGDKEVEPTINEVTETEVTTTIEEETKTVIEEEPIEIEQEEPVIVIQERENTTFRNSCWGDDIETVKKYEDAEYFGETENGIVYNVKLLDYETQFAYFFDENKLYRANYSILTKFSNPAQYIPVFNSLKDSLIEIYGEPIRDEIIPLADELQIEMAGAGYDFHYGYVVYYAEWKIENTLIKISLSAQNFKDLLFITYEDINYKKDVSDTGL